MVSDPGVDINTIIPAGDDTVIPFAVETLDIRGRSVQMSTCLDTILSRHNYPAPVARLLGEMIVLTALLGTSLKFQGQFITQSQTDGPVNLLIVDFRTPGDIRAYARFDEEELKAAEACQATQPEKLLGKGILAMTIDQGVHMQRYQGMVPLEGNSLEDVAHHYFLQSEQVPTRIRLCVAELLEPDCQGKTRSHWRAGGTLIQFMPQSEERMRRRDLYGGDGAKDDSHMEDNAWMEAQSLLATIQDDELTDPNIHAERLLFRLFHEHNLRLFEGQKIVHKCSCSGEKIWSVLKAMSDEEIAHTVKNGKIEVTCEFCTADYTVSPEALRVRTY